ncbi:hypothetical protein A9168_08375 [Macellibacteroides sp. HH-ZS]|nr:hypothetical protein A9168_08375 [Macellibacteroides sp. HH-ZS]
MRKLVLTVFYSTLFLLLLPALYFFKEGMYSYFFILLAASVLLFIARIMLYKTSASYKNQNK